MEIFVPFPRADSISNCPLRARTLSLIPKIPNVFLLSNAAVSNPTPSSSIFNVIALSITFNEIKTFLMLIRVIVSGRQGLLMVMSIVLN